MVLIDKSSNFSDVSFLYRSNAEEVVNFACFELANGNKMDTYVSAEESKKLFHMYRPVPDVAVVIVVDAEYPSRSAFLICRNIANEYSSNGNSFPGGKSQIMSEGIIKYQDPQNADKILKIQNNLAEAQSIMVTNLELAIARGESLEKLAEKADSLSASSKQFVRESKKLNGCCS
jgi:synaptobrevin family protein YKT6